MLTKKQASEKFVDTVLKLEQEGVIKNRRELTEKIGWQEQLLSNAMSRRRPVPMDKILMLVKTYEVKNFFDDQIVTAGSLRVNTKIDKVHDENDIDITMRLSEIKIKLSEII